MVKGHSNDLAQCHEAGANGRHQGDQAKKAVYSVSFGIPLFFQLSPGVEPAIYIRTVVQEEGLDWEMVGEEKHKLYYVFACRLKRAILTSTCSSTEREASAAERERSVILVRTEACLKPFILVSRVVSGRIPYKGAWAGTRNRALLPLPFALEQKARPSGRKG